MKYFFILGAKDLEMDAIESVLRVGSINFGYAGVDGKRCHPGNVNKATEVISVVGDLIADSELVVVECRYPGAVVTIDHHAPGDPGYGRPGCEAVEASSLGQIGRLLGFELTQGQKVIAAADHNLAAAYSEQIPGVSRDEVLKIRLPELASRNRVTEQVARQKITEAARLLAADAPRITIGGSEVADIRENGVQPFAVEAATIVGLNFVGRVDTRDLKKIFLSASAEVVAEFMANPPAGVMGVYGDPARGFAGGTQD